MPALAGQLCTACTDCGQHSRALTLSLLLAYMLNGLKACMCATADGDSLDEAVKMLRAEADQKAAGLANGSASVAGRLDPAGADGRRVKARLRASTPAQPALQVTF